MRIVVGTYSCKGFCGGRGGEHPVDSRSAVSVGKLTHARGDLVFMRDK